MATGDKGTQINKVPASIALAVGMGAFWGTSAGFPVWGLVSFFLSRNANIDLSLLKYGLTGNATLVEVAKIVHAADVSADIDTAPEGWGLKAIAHGFSLIFGRDDRKKIELESPMYDALYAWCQHRLGGAHRG
jgi:hypothetical protein